MPCEEHNLVIPEHVDITGEVDKQLERIGSRGQVGSNEEILWRKRQRQYYKRSHR